MCGGLRQAFAFSRVGQGFGLSSFRPCKSCIVSERGAEHSARRGRVSPSAIRRTLTLPFKALPFPLGQGFALPTSKHERTERRSFLGVKRLAPNARTPSTA